MFLTLPEGQTKLQMRCPSSSNRPCASFCRGSLRYRSRPSLARRTPGKASVRTGDAGTRTSPLPGTVAKEAPAPRTSVNCVACFCNEHVKSRIIPCGLGFGFVYFGRHVQNMQSVLRARAKSMCCVLRACLMVLTSRERVESQLRM